MRVTVREALSACSQVQRGGSDGLNQTICPSQPDTFLWREPNPGMQIYTWCQKRCVCLGVEGKILCAAIVFIAAYSYSMYCWVCSDLRLIFFFQQISVWCHELATAGVCWLSGFACVPTACMHSHWLWVLAYPHNREIVLIKVHTGCKTRMIKLHQWISKTTQIKAAVIKQQDSSVTGGSEKKEPQAHCNCFHVPRIKNSRGYLLLHLYDQMPSKVCF